jgi:hypothetical protein
MNCARSGLATGTVVIGHYLRPREARSTKLRVAGILVLLAASSSASTSAQAVEMLGAQVRVESSSEGATEGVVLEWGPTLLALRTAEGIELALPWVDVRDVAQYRVRRRTARGLAIGSLAGVVVGGVLAGTLVDPCPPNGGFCIGPDGRGDAFAIGAGLGVVAGGVLGALIGALITTSSWEPIAFPSASQDLAGPFRLRLGVSFR